MTSLLLNYVTDDSTLEALRNALYKCSTYLLTDMPVVGYWSLTTTNLSPFGLLSTSNSYPCIKQSDCAVASVYSVQMSVLPVVLQLYTVNHKKRDILFLTITLASLNRCL